MLLRECHAFFIFIGPLVLSTLLGYAIIQLLMSDVNGVQILEEIEQHKIRIYEFPECDSDEDEDSKQQDSELKVSAYVTFLQDHVAETENN